MNKIMGLRAKLILPLIILFLSLVIIIHFFLAPKYLQIEVLEFTQQQQIMLDSLQPEIKRLLINGDIASIHNILNTQFEIHQPEWKKIVLTNNDNKKLYPLFDDEQMDASFVSVKTNLLSGKIKIGLLEVYLDLSHQQKKMDNTIGQIEFLILIAVLVISALSFMWQNHIILKPLQHLKKCTMQLAKGDFNVSMPVVTNDEIGELNRHFDVMRIKLSEERKHLIDEKIKAEAAVVAKSTFLSTMSHEIRTPMNGILGMAQVLGGTQLSDNQKQYLQTIEMSGKNLLGIINDILDFSKIESGKMQIEDLKFNLHALIHDIFGLYTDKVEPSEVKMALEYLSNDRFLVQGDPGRIKQVLVNLLDNAVKFTKEGSITLCVKIEKNVDNKLHCRFQVQDTGIGMTETAVSTIFESFTQADGSTTRVYGGSGLGLAISRRLVGLMGGDMGVDSKLSKGSCFWFNLEFDTVVDSEIN